MGLKKKVQQRVNHRNASPEWTAIYIYIYIYGSLSKGRPRAVVGQMVSGVIEEEPATMDYSS